MLRNMDDTERIFYILGLLLAGGFILIFVLHHLHMITLTDVIPPCFFHLITGYYCPGCGGTRSVVALMNFQIVESFRYHPVVLYTAIWYFIYLSSHTIELFSKRFFAKKKESPFYLRFLCHIHGLPFRNIYVYVGIGILFLQWTLKNVL